MSSLQLPDWRNIGWHIGKRLKDIFQPSPRDSGPSQEERLAQRLWDVLKGFAYFDNFDELEAWSAVTVDPIQRANTPLLERSTSSIQGQAFPKSKVLLCHDYKGGYHDYESVRPSLQESQLYSCEYLQYVDTFIYFSHKLVCIPPSTWTNTLHRNGVKVMGTFVLEPQTPHISRLLAKIDGRYPIAEKLAVMATTYGFDGWLINIEKEFSTNVTEDMVDFMRELKNGLGAECQVIWYDALTNENEVKYQNGLTPKNLVFAQAADALFTNYKWTEAKLHCSKQLALANNIQTKDTVYFGIDLWAQNTDMPGPPRITFPPDGGGGTNTGLAMRTLAENCFATAIFAPGWVYEHFPTSVQQGATLSVAKAVDRSLWEGAALPGNVGCDCHKGKPHHMRYYRSNPITRYACQFPAGSSTFFDSDFAKAFTSLPTAEDKCRIMPSLGSQSPLPSLLPMSITDWEEAADTLPTRVMYGEHERDVSSPLGQGPNSILQIYTKILGTQREEGMDISPSTNASTITSNSMHRLRLYKLAMNASEAQTVHVSYGRPRIGRSVRVGFYIAYAPNLHTSTDFEYEHHEMPYDSPRISTLRIVLNPKAPGVQVVEFGIYCSGIVESSAPLLLLEMTRLSVVKVPPLEAGGYDFGLGGLKIVHRGHAPYTQRRLAWEWHGSREQWPAWLPWSATTGPFSHFTISVNGSWLGVAHCLELPLLDSDHVDEGVEVHVQGHLFGNMPTIRPVDTRSLV